jgi:hypothetical protein
MRNKKRRSKAAHASEERTNSLLWIQAELQESDSPLNPWPQSTLMSLIAGWSAFARMPATISAI